MVENSASLPAGAGGNTSDSPGAEGFKVTFPNSAGASGSGAERGSSARQDGFATDQREDHAPEGRDLILVEERSGPSTATIVGAALAGAIVGGAIPFMLGGRSSSASSKSPKREQDAIVTESVIVERPARELYDFWRDFTNLPQFMDNIKSVEKLDQKRSRWVIKAPVGTSVEFDSRVVDDVPGRMISWQSEEGATVPNRGRVEFIETASGNATNVRVTIGYDPPAGAAGRVVAKLFQREPSVQAREDLQRFKRLMEADRATG
jgi:uncharacterized membrane protein